MLMSKETNCLTLCLCPCTSISVFMCTFELDILQGFAENSRDYVCQSYYLQGDLHAHKKDTSVSSNPFCFSVYFICSCYSSIIFMEPTQVHLRVSGLVLQRQNYRISPSSRTMPFGCISTKHKPITCTMHSRIVFC
jgi:hypothetical protein